MDDLGSAGLIGPAFSRIFERYASLPRQLRIRRPGQLPDIRFQPDFRVVTFGSFSAIAGSVTQNRPRPAHRTVDEPDRGIADARLSFLADTPAAPDLVNRPALGCVLCAALFLVRLTSARSAFSSLCHFKPHFLNINKISRDTLLRRINTGRPADH